MQSGLQAQVEAGATFKMSTKKAAEDLDFVPVNLHIQQMKVNSELTENKGQLWLTFLYQWIDSSWVSEWVSYLKKKHCQL